MKMGIQIMVWKISAAPVNDLQRLAFSPSSLDSGTQQLPGGGYTTLRTFGGTRVLRMNEHFERLDESAHLMGSLVQIPRQTVRAALRQAVMEHPAPERRARLILDLQKEPGAIYILVEGLDVPSEQDYARGVRAVTRPMHRDNPKAKQTAFIEQAAQVRRALPPGVNEALMVGPDGRLLEGLSSNFFAVRHGVVWTEEQGVLSGITRHVVLDCAAEAHIEIVKEGIRCADLPEIQEAFITSASRAVLPVTEIDGQPVGAGAPGAVTRRLLAAYQARMEAEVEEI